MGVRDSALFSLARMTHHPMLQLLKNHRFKAMNPDEELDRGDKPMHVSA